MLRNEQTHRLTLQGNADLRENQHKIKEIYNYWRDKGYSIEEVCYMISTAAHACATQEALVGKR